MLVNQEISLNQLVTQVKETLVSDMAGEKVMLSINKGKYYNIGGVGGYIWDLIEEPVPVNKIVERLLSEFEVDRIDCEKQVISFLKDLVKEGLVEVK